VVIMAGSMCADKFGKERRIQESTLLFQSPPPLVNRKNLSSSETAPLLNSGEKPNYSTQSSSSRSDSPPAHDPLQLQLSDVVDAPVSSHDVSSQLEL